MNFYNERTKRKIAAVIVIILVIAMVLPLLLYAM
jgi:cytochrome c-type biogenesis protein CcmE